MISTLLKILAVHLVLSSTLAFAALDVRSFGAMGNGTADDTDAIQSAVNACPTEGTVNFPAGNYFVRGVYLRQHCNYIGVSGSTVTLISSNEFIFKLGEQSAVHISGMVLNGNGLGGAIIAQGYAPVSGINIDHCEFRNIVSSAHFPANLAIVSTWGLISSTIQSNHFVNVAGGIWLTTVENVSILNNSFTDVTQGDAIYVAPNPVSFPSGDNLWIAGNTGSRLHNMAIELFRPDPTNGSILTAPVVENNSFSDWTGVNGMGLSITHGDGAIVRGNRISNANGPMQANGIELIVANAQVTSNVVSGGFMYGIAVQGTAAPALTNNTITGSADSGIILSCNNQLGRCASRNAVISNNSIQNAQLVGIKLDNDWTGGHVTRNTIVRTAGAWAQDSGTLFSGIHQSPAPGPGYIEGNTLIQDAAVPVAGFWFCGVRINSQMIGSTVKNNVVTSSSSSPFGSGLIDNTGTATQGWLISGNQYLNLYHALN